jgi:hypothetical protein
MDPRPVIPPLDLKELARMSRMERLECLSDALDKATSLLAWSETATESGDAVPTARAAIQVITACFAMTEEEWLQRGQATLN